MWMIGLILSYLIILGTRDLVKRRVPLLWLGFGGVLFLALGIYRCIQDELAWMDILLGTLPGLCLILVARLSGKAGVADGVVLIQMGLCMGYRQVLFLFCFSMLLLSGVSVVLLLLRKVGRETRMPYITFLAITFLVWQLWGG